MNKSSNVGLLLLHALPLDESMWSAQMDLVSGSTYAPALYGFGHTLEAWAKGVLKRVTNNKLIVVGCSIGGSCALEMAVADPERIAALVLIGTKAKHDPDPALHASALDVIESAGINGAWTRYWGPMFSSSVSLDVVEAAKSIALSQSPQDIACGVTAFHRRKSRDRFLSQFRSPVIVISGEDDPAPGPKASAELAASAPLGSFHVIPSCGHYVPLERPEALNAILRGVLTAQFQEGSQV